ncbi:MAG: hypothetical protein COB49_03625 [Alphaproteobacteria bacterium]|nr:MAG: hypothetical protein COB49_03625 [Alphaproteobacteria bacterium]
MAEKTKDIKIPLKLRFKTWWEGYDLDDVKGRLKALQKDETSESSRDDHSGSRDGNAKEQTASRPWGKLRMEMSQLIWGDGYCGPGGKEHIATMCKLLTLNSEMSAIIIGAGFGGPARVLAEEFGVWITGFELSKELAEQGMQMSTDAGLASKAIIRHLDPEQNDPFDRLYDRGFSKEALYGFPDKAKILKDIYNTLKDGSLFLITDYTLSDISALENPDVQKWLRQEATQPYPVTAKNMKAALEKTGFVIRVNEDISGEYVGLIEGSWSKAAVVAQQLAKKGEEGTEAIKTLMEEAEYWALRAKLLKDGVIHVWRFLANKPNKEIR